MTAVPFFGRWKGWAALAAVALAAAAAVSAQSSEEKEKTRREQVLARFEGGQVTVGELEDEINQRSFYARKRYRLHGQLEEALHERVGFELLAREAQRRGFDRNPEVLEAEKKAAVQAMLTREIDEKITFDSIPQKEVEQYYQDNLSEFERPETRRVNRILLKTRQEALDLIPKVKEADMAAFRQLARDHSIDKETRFRGGDLLYFDAEGIRRGEREPAIGPIIVKAAFALATLGDVSPEPLQTEAGWSVIKLTGHRPASKRPLGAVQKTIRKRLWREKREQAIARLEAELRTSLKPEVKPELIDAIEIEAGRPGENIRPGFPRARPKKKP